MSIKIAITGCLGRMGSRIAKIGFADPEIKIIGATETKNHPRIGQNLGKIIKEDNLDVIISKDLAIAADAADVIIDFTSPSATISNLSIARSLKIPIVIGTTGLTDEEHKIIESAARSIPVLCSSNMSIGINVLFKIAPEAANLLGVDYDIEIIEAHHNKKKDSPSGTAKTLAENIADAKGKRLKPIAVYGREGNVGERKKGEIGIHSLRAGDIVGEHTIVYAGDGERIEITHRADSRDIFAKGALCAGKYIVDKSPGLYSMQNVIEGV